MTKCSFEEFSKNCCRLCLVKCKPKPKTPSVKFLSFTSEKLEMAQYCFPEFQTLLVNDPIICTCCSDELTRITKFKKMLLQSQHQLVTKKMSCNTNNSNSRANDDEEADSDCDEEISNIFNPQNTPKTPIKQDVFTAYNIADMVKELDKNMNFIKSSMKKNPELFCGNDEKMPVLEKITLPHCTLSPLSDGVKMKIHSIGSLPKPTFTPTYSATPSTPGTYWNERPKRSRTPSRFYHDEFPMQVRSRTPTHRDANKTTPKRSQTPNARPASFPDKITVPKRSSTPGFGLQNKRPKVSAAENSITNPFMVSFKKSYCLTCNEYFPNLLKFLFHLYQKHQDPECYYACMVCRYKGNSYKSLRIHFTNCHISCTDLHSSCFFCCTYLDSNEELLEHLSTDHRDLYYSNKIHCNSCHFKSGNVSEFKNHFFKNHDTICNVCLTKKDCIENLNRHLYLHYKVSNA